MAKAATTTTEIAPESTQPEATRVPTQRPRKSASDKIAALEAQIAATRAREATKAARARPEAQALLVAIKALGKASKVAAEAGDDAMVRALEASRAALTEQAAAMGLRVPETKTAKAVASV